MSMPHAVLLTMMTCTRTLVDCGQQHMAWHAVVCCAPSAPPRTPTVPPPSSSGTFEVTHIGDWYHDTQAAVLHLAGTHKKIIAGEAFCNHSCDLKASNASGMCLVGTTREQYC